MGAWKFRNTPDLINPVPENTVPVPYQLHPFSVLQLCGRTYSEIIDNYVKLHAFDSQLEMVYKIQADLKGTSATALVSDGTYPSI